MKHVASRKPEAEETVYASGSREEGDDSTIPQLDELAISEEELDTASLAPPCVVRNYLYFDVATLVAPGGTGKTFDWSCIPRQRPQALVLAGGLNAANVGRAIEMVEPCAVDISGGVESAPGIKDRGRVDEFIEAVKAADARRAG